MFGKLFGKKRRIETADDANAASGGADDRLTVEALRAASLDTAIEEARATDPVIHLKIGARELVQFLMDRVRTDRGVHIESLLAILGSVAGYACVEASLQQARKLARTPRECGLVEVATADGKRYYFGDPINHLLIEGDMSLFKLVAGMMHHLGDTDYPDVGEIAGYVARTIGTPEFGVPRIPDRHRPGDLSVNYVRNLWPAIVPAVERRASDPLERGTLLGLAVQNVMEMGRDAIAPAIAARLVLECAVPMSKLDPAGLWPAQPA